MDEGGQHGEISEKVLQSIECLHDYMELDHIPEEVATGFDNLLEIMDTHSTLLENTQSIVSHFISVLNYTENRILEELESAKVTTIGELSDEVKAGLFLTMMASINVSKYEIAKECGQISNTISDYYVFKSIDTN